LENEGIEEALLRGLIKDPDPPTSNRCRKRNKVIDVVSDTTNLILGEDLSMAEVLELADKSVVGKVYGRHFSEKTLKIWVQSTWGSGQTPPPQIRRLSRGWFLITFATASQATRALNGVWAIDSSPVLLNLWDPTFDAASARVDSFPIWVRLPSSHPTSGQKKSSRPSGIPWETTWMQTSPSKKQGKCP
jgi:hypothetical protein